MNGNFFARIGLGVLTLSVLGCLLVVYGLVKTMQFYTRPAPVDAARIAERQNALAGQQALDQQQLENFGWVDQPRGIVRLPITNAMELTLIEYRDPTTARTNLLTLLDEATAPLAKPPPPPNPFE